jgi:hypothetical protein
MTDQYVQRLPALGLSIERNTPAVPSDGYFYVLRDGVVLKRVRSLKSAQDTWRDVVAASGWTPPKPQGRTPEAMLAADRAARDRDARNEYWHSGRRHAW